MKLRAFLGDILDEPVHGRSVVKLARNVIARGWWVGNQQELARGN
jgi:hypothetical protein